MKNFWSSAAALLLVGCTQTSEPDETIGTKPLVSDATANTIGVCSAGLSSDSEKRLQAAVDLTSAEISAESREAIRGIIFEDPTLDSEARVQVFRSYLDCVERRFEEQRLVQRSLPIDATRLVLIDNNATSWSEFRGRQPRGSLTKLNWVADFEIDYVNEGPRAVSCKAVATGLHVRRFTGQRIARGQSLSARFVLKPGDRYVFRGSVGAPGSTNASEMVTLSDELSCAYVS